MITHSTARPRAIALLLATIALPATPAFAQDATVVPPPVTATVPAPTPAPDPAPPSAAAPAAPVFAPPSEVVQPLPQRAAPVAETPARATTRPAPRAVTRAAPARPARVAAPTPAPVAVTPAPTPVEPPAPVTATPPVAEPTPAPVDTTSTSTTTTTSTTPWIWIGLAALAVVGALLLLFGRRRRTADVYDEPYEPVAVAPVAPVMAAPVVAPVIAPEPIATREPIMPRETLTQPTPVAEVADGERPWIGLSLWPTSVKEGGLVEYDLIVENAGEVAATDVQVSSFLIDGSKSTPMEAALIGGSDTRTITVAPGASVPIARAIDLPAGVTPKIVAEARYPLPGGGEGHIAARFAIETGKDGAVEASLDDLLERV